MSNESEIASRFAGWMSEHWPWLSGSALAVAYVMRKVYQFFQGQNRQAAALEILAKEVRKHGIKLDKMVDADGVDLRVAPVIQTVVHLRERAERIENKQDEMNRNIMMLVERDPRSRPGDQ